MWSIRTCGCATRAMATRARPRAKMSLRLPTPPVPIANQQSKESVQHLEAALTDLHPIWAAGYEGAAEPVRYLESWDAYIRYRGLDEWVKSHPKVAKLVLSKLLSYPLTLAKHIPDMLGHISAAEAHLEATTTTIIDVIGARQEASLPPQYWASFPEMLPGRSFTIRFVGPHVPAHFDKQTHKVVDRLTVQYSTSLYHDSELVKAQAPDALVFFNAGVGHPGEDKHWAPTLEQIFNATSPEQQEGEQVMIPPPMLFTTFGSNDHKQDLATVGALVKKSNSGIHIELEGDNAMHSLWGEPATHEGGEKMLPNTSFFTVVPREY